MWIIGWFIIGLIAGALARLIMPGRDPMGCIATALLGMAGGALGGWVSTMIWPDQEKTIFNRGLILSTIGAIILLAIWRLIQKRRA